MDTNKKINEDFPRLLALLRKERNLSQKQAATDLGVGQALLSHYEKGKRECGLEFLVRVADYYNVSTDFLLGRASASNGGVVGSDDILDSGEIDRLARYGKNFTATLARKMIIGGVDIVYSLLTAIDNQKLLQSVTDFLMLSVYSCFRLVHRANPNNNTDLFGVPEQLAFRSACAARNVCEGKAVLSVDEVKKTQRCGLPLITSASLESDYGMQSTALMSMVKNCEKLMR